MSRIGVVGGGIIGSAVAAWLEGDGHAVTLFEAAPDAQPASAGNAGLLALPEISPLARPGVLGQVPFWLTDPLGPLSLRWRDLPAYVPWLARLVASARPRQVIRATAALAFLMRTALVDHQELARRAALSGHIRRTGALHVFDSLAGLRHALAEWKERQAHGVAFREVSPDEARALAPALAGPFAAAILAPEYWVVSSPAAVLAALRRRLRHVVPERVIEVRADTSEVALLTDKGADLPFDQVVVAGGVWSRDLVRALGLKVLLECERGYNTTFPVHALELPLPIFFAEHGFVASPLADGIRVGGAVELAAPDAPPNFARAAAMRAKARRYMPGLPESGGAEWMGRRPSTPDSLPVISRHPRDPRIIFAFGHGHLGLTLSAVTARHVAALLRGTEEAGLAPFAIDRFQ